jgi:diguanylate cyclase (GGDEF)-like protein/PAS domain S-box-containing protein
MLSQQELAEEERVKALHALGVLDTPQEDRFDRFTRIATAAFGAPIALVSLVDAKRQWFKSRTGLDISETPRSMSFCSHAVALDDVLVVPDTHLDERFAGNPLVVGAPFIRFYAGQPLHGVDGQALGALCVIDRQPRQFGEPEKRMLRDLAQMVQDELNRSVLAAAHDAALLQKQELLDALLESVDVGVVACGADGAPTLFNRAARELHGMDAAGIAPQQWAAHCHLFDEDGITPLDEAGMPLARALRGEQVKDVPMVIARELPDDGLRAHRILASGRALKGPNGEMLGAMVAMKDVTELAESRARVIESEERLRTIADNVPALIAYIDTGMRYIFANQRYQEWFGVKSADMLGKTVAEAMGETFYAPRRAALERCLAGHASALEIEEERRGRRRVISTTYLPHVRNGMVQGIYVLSTDATSAREYERQLHALAHADQLTGLPNRRSFEERLVQAIARSRRSAMAMALVYLDVDHFRQINDSLGHASGDSVLREIATRLSSTVRATDTVARLAGDEFVIVLEQVGSPRECARIADKLLDALRADFLIDGQARQVTASIGIAWTAYPEQAALAQAADDALHESKRTGRNTATVLTAGGR